MPSLVVVSCALFVTANFFLLAARLTSETSWVSIRDMRLMGSGMSHPRYAEGTRSTTSTLGINARSDGVLTENPPIEKPVKLPAL